MDSIDSKRGYKQKMLDRVRVYFSNFAEVLLNIKRGQGHGAAANIISILHSAPLEAEVFRSYVRMQQTSMNSDIK